MAKKTKVYSVRTVIPQGIKLDQRPHIVQCTAVVTASSQAQAAERMGVSLHQLRTYGGETHSQHQVEAAMARPGTVVYFPSDSRPTDTPVYGPTQLGYTAPELADNQLADTSTDEELDAMLSALGPIRGTAEDPRPVPTKDQSYCQVGDCQSCSGLTEDEADPETCMCACHSPEHVLGDWDRAPQYEGTSVLASVPVPRPTMPWKDRMEQMKERARQERTEAGLDPDATPREGAATWPAHILAALDATRARPHYDAYTVVPAFDDERGSWYVAAILRGHAVEYVEDGREACVLHIVVEAGDDVDHAARMAVRAMAPAPTRED